MATIGTVTWWGASGVELEFNGRRLVVDPYLHPVEPRAHYICVTRENFDHCHEPTLERLTGGEAFERLLAPRSCTVRSTLDTPVPADSRDLDFVDPDRITLMFPKYARKPSTDEPLGTTEIELDGYHVEAVESSETDGVNVLGTEYWGKRHRPEDGTLWPAGTGRYVGARQLPPLGYVIRETSTGTTFYHPGDLQEAFDSQRELRGRIDYMFLPTVSLEGVELSVIDNVRPRYVVPIHYRLTTPDFPIPLEMSERTLTTTDLAKGRPKPWAAADAYRRDVHAMMAAHWYPTLDPPLERVESIAGQLADYGAELLVLEAGRPYGVRAGASEEADPPHAVAAE